MHINKKLGVKNVLKTAIGCLTAVVLLVVALLK